MGLGLAVLWGIPMLTRLRLHGVLCSPASLSVADTLHSSRPASAHRPAPGCSAES